ncbi:MAG: hypothetical protein ACO3JE_03145 [Burkholderiaceae bacterium]
MNNPLMVDAGLVTQAEATSLQRWAHDHADAVACRSDDAVSRGLSLLLARRAVVYQDPHTLPDLPLPGHMAWWASRWARQCGAKATAFPWAALLAEQDGLCPTPDEVWLVLTPGALAMTPQQVGLRFPLEPLVLPTPAVDALATELGHIGEVISSESGQLYLRMASDTGADDFELITAHPSILAGQHLPDFEPRGHSARAWRHATHRVQMAWHALSEQLDTPLAVDTLWAWGAGTARSADDPKRPSLPTPPRCMDLSRSIDPARDWFDTWRKWLAELGSKPDVAVVAVHQWSAFTFEPIPLHRQAWHRLSRGRPSLSDLPHHLAIPDPSGSAGAGIA